MYMYVYIGGTCRSETSSRASKYVYLFGIGDEWVVDPIIYWSRRRARSIDQQLLIIWANPIEGVMQPADIRL